MSATSTGLVNARPPSLAGRAKRARSSSEWSIRPVMIGMRVCLIFSSIGPSNCEMLGVVLMRKDHVREEPRARFQLMRLFKNLICSPWIVKDHF